MADNRNIATYAVHDQPPTDNDPPPPKSVLKEPEYSYANDKQVMVDQNSVENDQNLVNSTNVEEENMHVSAEKSQSDHSVNGALNKGQVHSDEHGSSKNPKGKVHAKKTQNTSRNMDL